MVGRWIRGVVAFSLFAGAVPLAGQTVLTLSASSYRAGEAGPAMITVARGVATGTATVRYATADGTATGGSDYTPTSGTLTFAPGESRKRFAVPLLNDAAQEPNETFTVSLSDPGEGASLGSPAAATVTIVDDDTPAVSGQWGPVVALPSVPIHMHVLPSGKVMFWDRHDMEKGWHADPYLWDPATQSTTPLAQPPYDVFCSGHSFLADGRLLVAGGHIFDDVGENRAAIYDPSANTWSLLPLMNAGRWYPSSVTLASGDALVVAGTATGAGKVNPMPQVWQTAGAAWRNLTGAPQGNYPVWPEYYPYLYQAPNGRVFDAGPQQMSRYLDTSGAGAWTEVAASSMTYREYGTSALYADGKVLIVGGNERELDENAPPVILPSETAEVIDLNAPVPAWRLVPPLSAGRRQHNATLLPDGQVLVTGGSAFTGFDNPAGVVLYPEMWDPAGESWSPMAGYARYRGYHSVAVLLPDARVLIGGGGHPDPQGGSAEPNLEVYSPPYLFKGARPVLTSAPAEVLFGDAFFVGTPDPQVVTAVTWVRLSSVTHGFNENQRLNRLAFSPATAGVTVTAPASGRAAPPGHYMLFLLNAAGVPSVSRIVRLRSLPSYGFHTLTPCRAVDTRNASGPYGGPALQAASDRAFTLAGVCGIPADAAAIMLNVTATQPAAGGVLRFYPGGTPVPVTSTISFGPGQTRANNTVAALGEGTFVVRNDAAGEVHLIVDVSGYFR